MTVNKKSVEDVKYDIGDIVYVLNDCDGESKWITKAVITAFFPSLLDTDLDNVRDMNFYTVRYLYVTQKGMDFYLEDERFKSERDLFNNRNFALQEAYRRILKEWENEENTDANN